MLERLQSDLVQGIHFEIPKGLHNCDESWPILCRGRKGDPWNHRGPPDRVNDWSPDRDDGCWGWRAIQLGREPPEQGIELTAELDEIKRSFCQDRYRIPARIGRVLVVDISPDRIPDNPSGRALPESRLIWWMATLEIETTKRVVCCWFENKSRLRERFVSVF